MTFAATVTLLPAALLVWGGVTAVDLAFDRFLSDWSGQAPSTPRRLRRGEGSGPG